MKGLSFIKSSSGRTQKAQKNILGMLLIKICNIIINLAYVPLLINSLNQDRYGIWLTITTIVSWIAFFDIGLGNGLRNKLAESIACKDEIKENAEHVQIAILIFAVFLLIIILLHYLNCINIYSFTGCEDEEIRFMKAAGNIKTLKEGL